MAHAEASRIRILADVDTGIDDSLALIYLAGLHRAEEIELVGITCSAGNTTAAQAVRNTKYMLNLCGCPEVPVACGFSGPQGIRLTTTPETHGPAGLGYNLAPPAISYEPGAHGSPDPLALWRRVVDKAASEGEKVRLLVTGPLTTYAAALEQCPRLLGKFSSVTIMGGALDYPGNTTEFSEWNFWVDPHAVSMVFPTGNSCGGAASSCGASTDRNLTKYGVPVPMLAPLNVTETIMVDNTDLESWRAAGLGWEIYRVLRRSLQFYFEFHQWVGVGYLAQIHDLFAAMVAVGTVEFDYQQCRISGVPAEVWQRCPAKRGQIVRDCQGTPAQVVTAVSKPAVLAEFSRAIGFLES